MQVYLRLLAALLDHLLRGIDRFFDADDLRQHLAPFYSHTGRPSVDPEFIVRMLIVGYCLGIRSEHRLREEVRPPGKSGSQHSVKFRNGGIHEPNPQSRLHEGIP